MDPADRSARLLSLVDAFASKRVLVVGDLIGVSVLDSENGDTGDVWGLVRVEGTPQSVPVDPTSLPDYWTPLARIRMPASTSAVQNSYVDDLRVFTAAAGGVIGKGW